MRWLLLLMVLWVSSGFTDGNSLADNITKLRTMLMEEFHASFREECRREGGYPITTSHGTICWPEWFVEYVSND